jgi:hypothetical protein
VRSVCRVCGAGAQTIVNNFSYVADRLGIFASITCALHCLLFPVLLVAGWTLPAAFLDDALFHQLILLVALPSALVAFGLGCSRHKDLRVIGLGVLGFLGLTAAAVLHDALGENGERFLTFGSTILLVSAHIRNYRLCRAVGCDDE